MRLLRSACFPALFAIAACDAGHVGQGTREPVAAAATAAEAEPADVELVESFPLETSLDHAAIRDAADVWPAMIARARSSLDIAEFYASEADPAHVATSKLAPVLVAIEEAIARGVRVRFLSDASFVSKYPETLERLRRAGALVRAVDFGKLTGGILHAKYFVVDGTESFIGSQNFDWRALAHIQEIGVRLRSRAIAAALADVFEIDWAIAAGATAPPRAEKQVTPAIARGGERISLVASPKGWLPDEDAWDLPRLARAIDAATAQIDVQVLLYSRHDRDGSPFTTLDDALRRAAGRGAKVRLLVSHWGAKPGGDARGSIEALASAPNVEVRVLTIPPWSGGEIPFARVAHAKYAVFDRGAVAWVGTSNWEGDYFTKSRNVGVMIDGGALPKSLEVVFEDGWTSAYASALPPSGSDPARR